MSTLVDIVPSSQARPTDSHPRLQCCESAPPVQSRGCKSVGHIGEIANTARALYCAIALIALLSLAPFARAQGTSALINEALDKITPLSFKDTPLPQFMQTIAKQTGVRVEASPAVWELLPWGEQTVVTARVENATLREALEAITRKLGLVFVLKDEAVELQPMPALRRLGRRSTVQELAALDLLVSTPLGADVGHGTLRQVIDAVDARLEALDADATKAGKAPLGIAIENRTGSSVATDAPVSVPRGATLLTALESITKDTRATWYPWGRSVVIVPKEDQIQNQLGKTISIRYNGVDVAQVLSELSGRSGVDFAIEPGAIQRISPEARTIKLILDNATIRQALEDIAGFTGLGYVVNERGVYLWNQSSKAATDPSVRPRDPVVGMIPLDSGMQLFLPESQVPADIREYLKARRDRELEKIRQMMKEEGFKPTTAPAAPTTKPTGNEDL